MTFGKTGRWGVVVLVVVVACGGWLLMGLVGSKAGGVVEGQLCGCPTSPNCVSSAAADEAHRVAAIAIEGTVESIKSRLLDVVRALPRTRVVVDDGLYLHVTFTSLICRYVDDVEFLIDPQQGVIQVRSLSRVGHSDLGVNRARVEKIRERLSRMPPPAR